jgi:2'-5' RNA ligase
LQVNGIFILAELPEGVAERIRAINERYDPRLARYKPPHVTLTGSSGAAPERFMQTNIIVLPIDSHGALRILHDRIVTSGLPFSLSRFTFSPHCTLSLYQTLGADSVRELLKTRITEPFVINAIQLYHTRDPQPSRKLLELPLTGGIESD